MVDIIKDTGTVSYEVRVTDPFGDIILVVDEFQSLDYARKVNNVGELSLTVQDSGEKKIYIPENRIEVWRTVESVSKLDMNATWFIHTATHSINNDGSRVFEIEAHDQVGLLKRRIVPYNEGNPTTEKNEYADDMMKDIMEENFGPTASDSDRDLSTWLTIQGHTSSALADVTKFFAKENIFDIFTDLANRSYEGGIFLAFDFYYNPSSGMFEFRTYTGQRGTDLSVATDAESIILGVEYGSLDKMSLIDSRRDERNFIYAGAKDLVGIVPPISVYDTLGLGISPFNRKELFLNASSTDDDDELQTAADAALEDNRYKLKFEAEMAEGFATKAYGNRLNYGDKVSVSFDGNLYTAYLDAVRVSITDSEKIEILLAGADE